MLTFVADLIPLSKAKYDSGYLVPDVTPDALMQLPILLPYLFLDNI